MIVGNVRLPTHARGVRSLLGRCGEILLLLILLVQVQVLAGIMYGRTAGRRSDPENRMPGLRR